MLDLYGKTLQCGDKVAVKPNSGYYGKWKVGTIILMRDDCVRVRYDEACLYQSDTECGFERRFSFGTKWCQDVILLDKETLLPIGKV